MIPALITGFLVLVSSLPATAEEQPAQGAKEPTPVEDFELERYLGKWHQLALIPMSFQKQCVKNTTATYSVAEEGLVRVVNRCTTDAGEQSVAEARARINEDYGKPSTLEVTFAKLLGYWLWFASGDYWVIDLDKNYETAIVGHPDHTYGWILSRKPAVGIERYKELAATLVRQGYDTCQFEMSTTPGQTYPAKTKLCDIVKAN